MREYALAERAADAAPELMRGTLTLSGRLVRPDSGVPSMEDIATALARQPRFGGHTRQWWSVACHSLFVSFLAQYAGPPGRDKRTQRDLEMVALLHDAHEAMTGDVPTPFKPKAMRDAQHEIDARIFNAYMPGGAIMAALHAEDVRELDRRAMLAEAYLVGPPSLTSYADVEQYFGDAPNVTDVELLREFCEHPGIVDAYEARTKGADAGIVGAFIGRYVRLL